MVCRMGGTVGSQRAGCRFGQHSEHGGNESALQTGAKPRVRATHPTLIDQDQVAVIGIGVARLETWGWLEACNRRGAGAGHGGAADPATQGHSGTQRN